MPVIGATPPPLSTDLIDTRAIRFQPNQTTGQMEVVPGSLVASAPWLIWFNTNFASQGNVVDVVILEALDQGVGIESVTALRDAQAALIEQATSTSPADLISVARSLEKSIAVIQTTPDVSAAVESLNKQATLQPPSADFGSALSGLQTLLALVGGCNSRNWGVISGLHADRATIPGGGLNLTRVYFETDRNALYTSINNVWTYMAGMMVAVAADRPADLSTDDVNFFFLSSDTFIFSYWDGAAWIDIPTSGVTQTTGTWTADITFGGSNTGMTYSSSQTMHYIKTGNVVTATVDLTLSNKGSSTGVAEITGLPFSVAAAEVTLGCFQYAANMLLLTSTPTILPELGTTKASTFHFGAAGATQLADTNFTNTSRIIASFTYQT